jgi:hypothetical protein
MPGPLPKTQKADLALHVANGGTVPPWCEKSGVAKSTAYEWQKTAWFQRMVEEYRRRAVDSALGLSSANLRNAVERLVKLIDTEPAGSLQLAAARALLDQHVKLDSHTDFKTKLEDLNQRLAAEEKRRAKKSQPV